MSLQTTKSVTLQGNSTVSGNQIVYLTANVTTESAGNTSITQNIQNQELYRTNLKECRGDINAFQEKVWAIEDSLLTEIAAESK